METTGKAKKGAAAVTAVAVLLVVRHRMQNSGKWAKAMDIVKKFEEKCATPVSKLRQVADAMTVEMHAGLASVGGTNFRVRVKLGDDNVEKFQEKVKIYKFQLAHNGS
ncbi:putative hexokinase [Helianthus anomalus]